MSESDKKIIAITMSILLSILTTLIVIARVRGVSIADSPLLTNNRLVQTIAEWLLRLLR